MGNSCFVKIVFILLFHQFLLWASLVFCHLLLNQNKIGGVSRPSHSFLLLYFVKKKNVNFAKTRKIENFIGFWKKFFQKRTIEILNFFIFWKKFLEFDSRSFMLNSLFLQFFKSWSSHFIFLRGTSQRNLDSTQK